MILAQKWKVAAVAVGLIPVAFFLLFAIGEGSAGWAHYLQAALPIAALLCAWWKPRIGGYILIGLALPLAVAYLVVAFNQPPMTIALVELIVFAPAAASGYLFLKAAKKNQPSSSVL